MSLTKLANETELQYIWRIGRAKDQGLIDMTWTELADVMNRELRDEDETWTESAYRKKYAQAKAFYEEVFSKMETHGNADTVDMELKRELEQARIQFRDERNAWQRQNYVAARTTQKLDYLEELISKEGRRLFADHSKMIPPHFQDSEKGLLVVLSDLHIGETFSSCWGQYDADVAKELLQQYLDKVISIGRHHNVSKIAVACLGDLINGNIHKTIQVTNRENVIEQIKIASEYISNFCYELTKNFKVEFYSVPGNHSRIDKKEDAIKDERLDDLIAWFVGNSLKHISNFTDHTRNRADSTLDILTYFGNVYCLVHGDCDVMSEAGISKLVMMCQFMPDYVISAHRHSPAMLRVGNVTMYQSGSLVGGGSDYCMQHRMTGKPSQLVLVCDSNGVDCAYNVDLVESKK